MTAARAGQSQKIRAAWAAEQSDEEARAFLQSKLTNLFELMFYSVLALAVFLGVLYSVYETYAPKLWKYVALVSVVGLTAMVIIWRGMLAADRRQLSVEALYGIDIAYSLGIGTSFAASAYLQSDLRPSGYMSLVYMTFTVFARALIVPSSWKRTLGTSILMFAPMTISAALLAFQVTQELPGPSYFFGYLLLSFVPITLATFGSNTIWGLRNQVNAAKQLGQYTIKEELGRGGMGVVYRAEHVLLRRRTAIKLIHPKHINPESLARFEREVQNTSKLTHPNTVAVFDFGRSADGRFYYAMEDLGHGIDLDRIAKGNPQPAGRVVHILVQVCGALQEAHDLGLVHRDIKPANIILCERGGIYDVAKVVDFGLAKDITMEEIGEEGWTTGNRLIGTPSYLAPESVQSDRIDGRADLYALGAVGYFLLTGQTMFSGENVITKHLTETPRPPREIVPSIAAELEAIILRCVEKLPSERYQRAADLADALRSFTERVPSWSDEHARDFWETVRTHESDVKHVSDAETVSIVKPEISEIAVDVLADVDQRVG